MRDFQIFEWEVQPRLNSIRKGTEEFHLEPKVMQVLVKLAEQPGEVFTKDHLMSQIWPNTFVGDDALIRCISEIRRVFKDDPRSPRVIQTIAKQGYRLIGPVTYPPSVPKTTAPTLTSPEAGSATAPATAAVEDTGDISLSPGSPPQANRAPLLGSKRNVIVLGILVITALAFAAMWSARSLSTKANSGRSLRVIPFTSNSGSERQPVFSPDGRQIAYIWNNENDDSWNVFVKMIGSETPLRLTSTAARDISPTWSPDSKFIAFIRYSTSGSAIYVVPSIGGSERRIYQIRGALDWDSPGLSWSPDGKRLIFPEGKSGENPSAIHSLSLDTLQLTQISKPENSWDGDFSPAYSPDGTKIAFVRGADAATRNIYVMEANGDDPRQLTFDGRIVFGLTWMSDGKGIVFASDRGGSVGLWQVSLSGGTPERLSVGAENAYEPTIATGGKRLAFSQGLATWNLLRVDLQSPQSPPTNLSSSSAQDSAPKYSPDSRHLAFQSWRSGSQEIWISSADGTGPVKLTSFDGPITGSPSWSPDGHLIAFDSRPKGDHSHIFIMSSDGGTPKQLTTGDFNDIIPSWSHNGNWIYFGSKRTGAWEIWKINIERDKVIQVTRNGGFVGAESRDGQWLYYTKYNAPGLWRMAMSGGEEERILDWPPPNFWGCWSLSDRGIYYFANENSQPSINFQPYSSSRSEKLVPLKRLLPQFSGISVSPDGHWLAYSDQFSTGANIMLVENMPF